MLPKDRVCKNGGWGSSPTGRKRSLPEISPSPCAVTLLHACERPCLCAVCANGCAVTPPEPEPRTLFRTFPTATFPKKFSETSEKMPWAQEKKLGPLYRLTGHDQQAFTRTSFHAKPLHHPSPLRCNKSQLVGTSPLQSVAFAPTTSVRNPLLLSSPALLAAARRESIRCVREVRATAGAGVERRSVSDQLGLFQPLLGP